MLASSIGRIGGQRTVRISANQTNYNLHTALGSPSGSVRVTVIIDSGVVISSNNASTPAFDEGSLGAGSTVLILNSGKIYAMGGVGGAGESVDSTNTDISPIYTGSPNGGVGGTALKLSAKTIINNAVGEIFGGGGGGGASAAGIYNETGGTNEVIGAGGSGGGRGQGGTTGAGGVKSTILTGSHPALLATVNNGASGGLSGPGAGGTGNESPLISGVYIGSESGGAGGAWGQAGSAGGRGYSRLASSYFNPQTLDGSPRTGGSGGAGGKAVDLNGFAVTWLSGNDSTHVKGAVS